MQRAQCWSIEDSTGYAQALERKRVGKRRLATLLAPKWAKLVTQTRVVMENHAHWFILGGLLGGNLGVVNIYVPNKSALRIRLWETLLAILPFTCHWIVQGDFNMVKTHQDKTNPCRRLVPNGECLIFQAMKANS